jgi:hypothetical protein
MPSDLQVSNIKDLTGSNTGLSIASDGQVSITKDNPTVTLGSNATFPVGHVIQYVSVLNTTSSGAQASDDGATFGTSVTISSPQDGSKIVAWAIGGKAVIIVNNTNRKTKCGINFSQSGASGTPNFYFTGGTEAFNYSIANSYLSAPGVAFAEYTSDGTNDIVISCRCGRYDSFQGQWDAGSSTPIRITAMEVKQ